jgi:hypothetical protein
MNIYFNGTSHAVQRAQTAGNGYWYVSGNKILTIGGSDNDPVPYSFPLRFVPVENGPANLIVAAGDAKDILEWTPSHNLTYNIKRSTTSGGPYTTIAHVGTTRFTDTTVSNGTIYYYVVASVDSVGEVFTSTEVAASPNVGQLICLKFDEPNGTRAIDSWGAMHGTLAATATRNAGKSGNSLKLDGTATAYATLPAGIVSSLSDFTITTWVKMDAISNWMRVFDFGNSTTQYMFLTLQAGTTTVNGVRSSIVRYAIKNGGTELNVSAPYVFPLNTWVQLAVTQKGDTARLYINGVLAATNTALNIKPSQLTPAGATTGTSLNYLGKSQFNDPVFNGSIDVFKIYRRALSNAEMAPVNATIPDVYAMDSSLDARNTMYIGYGPTSLTITANASGGLAPYAYSWSDGQTSQSISVSTAGTYSVTVTDSKGFTTTAGIVINTLDVRCGNNNNKVMICHNHKAICISSEDVQDHLNHGDHLGDCAASVARIDTDNGSAGNGKIIVYPNPVSEEWNIQVSGVEAGSVVKMYDQNGALVKTLLVKKASEAISVRGLPAGMYYLQIKTRGVIITKKIVKL